ncbi:molybdopterin molybdotransferase MoeA [Halovulum sp. GXIMD14793]
MIPVAEALERVLALADRMPVETVPLDRTGGRVLAETVTAKRTQPPFAASAMDGYAVRDADAQPGMVLQVVGEAAAGSRHQAVLSPGTAVRIFTGAPVPDGADAILIQEDAIRGGDRITVREGRDTRSYIRPAGADFAQGDPLNAPRRLTSCDIALAAAMNHASLPVRRRPVIALIATGNELVMPGDMPGPDQIVSSNNFGLAAMVEAIGGRARLLPIASDTAESLTAAFDLAMGADLIVTLGGASVGDHDLVQSTGTSMGLALDFYKIAMRPGKPLMAGKLRGTPMLGLPGNPVSAMVCGVLFLRPIIERMLGLPDNDRRQTAPLANDLPANGPRAHYMRARLVEGQAVVAERQDSALLSVLGQADILVIREPHADALKAGHMVDYIPLD